MFGWIENRKRLASQYGRFAADHLAALASVATHAHRLGRVAPKTPPGPVASAR